MGGSQRCSACQHSFFAHGPGGCHCGCTEVRGGLFGPSASPEDILRAIRPGTGGKNTETDPKP